MSNSEKIHALKQEIYRLKKARQSDFARHIDISNLVNAKDKLRSLELEARISVSEKNQILS